MTEASDEAGTEASNERAAKEDAKVRRRSRKQAKVAREAQAEAARAEEADADAGADASNAEPAVVARPPLLAIELGTATTRWCLFGPAPEHAIVNGAFPSAVMRCGQDGWRVGEKAVAGSLLASKTVFWGPSRLLPSGTDAQAAHAARARLDEGAVCADSGEQSDRPRARSDDASGEDDETNDAHQSSSDAKADARAVFVDGDSRVEPVVACAALLAQVVQEVYDAGHTLPEDIELLVPATADFAERRAWRQAAALAGLEAPTLRHATAAAARSAATAFASKVGDGVLCVVDVGASGVGVTVLQVSCAQAEPDPEGQADGAPTADAAAPTDEAASQVETVSAADEATDLDAALDLEAADDRETVLELNQTGATAARALKDTEPAKTDEEGASLSAAELETAAPADGADEAAPQAGGNAAFVPVPARPEAPKAPARPRITALQVLAHRAALDIGGEAQDRALVGWLQQGFMEEHGISPGNTPLGRRRLWATAKRSREALAQAAEVEVNLPHLVATAKSTHHLKMQLRRDILDALVSDTQGRIAQLCRAACRAAGFDAREVRGWACVGGLALSHGLPQALRKVFGRNPLVLDVPATNAAIEHVRLGPKEVAPVQEASVSALGRTLPDGSDVAVIPAHTPLPHSTHFVVTTEVNEQDLLRVPLLVGDPADPLSWHGAGQLEIAGLPAVQAGLEVEVHVTLDAHGQLTLTAHTLADNTALDVQHRDLVGLEGANLAAVARTYASEAEARLVRRRLNALRADAETLLQQTEQLAAVAREAQDDTASLTDVDGDADAHAPAQDPDDAEHMAAMAEREAHQAELREALRRALAAAQEDAQLQRLSALSDLVPLEGHLRALRAAAKARPAATAMGA